MDGGSLVKQLVEKHEKSLKSVQVTKQIQPTIDSHYLTVWDDNIVNDEKTPAQRVRESAQLIINEIFENTEHVNVDGVMCAKLPIQEVNIFLPREKPLPKEKPKTKWEQFAETKGIKKRRKARMEWDDTTKQWIPAWGYKSKRHQKNKEWAIEIPDQAPDDTDMFQKRKEEHNKRVAKNEFQRLRNIGRNLKQSNANQLNINPTGGGDKQELSKQFHIAKKSTASLGKFDTAVRGEQNQVERGVKRKFQPNQPSQGEKDRMMKLAQEVSKGDHVLNAKKAAGRLMAGQQGEAGTGKKKMKIGMKAKAKAAQRAGSGKQKGKKGR